MAYSGKITISGTEQKSFVTAYSKFLRFVTSDSSVPGRDWEIIECTDDSGRANNFNYIQYSGSLSVTENNIWLELPTVHVYNYTFTRQGVTLQEGTDYQINTRLGYVKFLTGSPPYEVNYNYQFRRARVVLKNTGLDGQRLVFIGFLMVSSGFDRANIITRSYKLFIPNNTDFFDTTVGNSTPRVSNFDCCWGLWNGTIDMWIFSNKQRIIVVARNNTIYTFCYSGRFFQFSLPSEYPYPLINTADLWVKADLSSAVWHDSTSTDRRFIIRSRFDGYGRAVCIPGGTWQYTNTVMLPFGGDNEESNYYPVSYMSGWKRVLLPSYVYSSPNCLGALDGCYWAPGLNLASESVIEIDGKSYIIFQDCFRTNYENYMAILCE